jgi:hypothetical protein
MLNVGTRSGGSGGPCAEASFRSVGKQAESLSVLPVIGLTAARR